ncbi:MAG: BON domain-containing protein [Proteobacteria bacterium]|nr:BON domain-containing protein [Pseudomonadota bacterium]
MRSDTDIKKDVEAELRWSPDVDETDIAVKVNDGEVTLSGFTDSYLSKYQAEIATRRIKGAAAVANDIAVKPLSGAPTDPQIARAAVQILKTELPTCWEQIKPVVKEGHVSLEGTVEWHYQRERAESAVRHLAGVVGVRNSIKIRPSLAPDNIKHRIEEAFRRLAQVDADHIVVDTSGSEVLLKGEVRSWSERDQAQRSAWSAPGVTNVKNELTVRS